MSDKIYRESNHPGLYYQDMLADRVRMERYAAAIEAVARPGMVVADLGTGTTILAMMAARAGAAQVYAIEIRPHMIEMARKVIAANGLADRITVLNADAADVILDAPVDLVLNELIGDFGTDENIVESVAAFAARNLKPEGRFLPESLTTWLVPVEYGDEFRGVYRADLHGFDLRAALDFPFEAQPIMRCLYERAKELAAPLVAEDLRFARDMPARRHEIPFEFTISAAGDLQGFVGYFSATLAPGIEIVSYPCYPSAHWQMWNWPVTPPMTVAPGQTLAATLFAPPNMVAGGWRFEWEMRE